MTQPTQSDSPVFTNLFPEDKEWTAHVKLLNEWTEPDRYLRQIIQYARSGKFYPTNMHVELIEQAYKALYAPKPDEDVEEIVHLLSDDIADAFGGDIYEHPQQYFEEQAIKKLAAHYAAKEQEAYIAGVNADKRSVQESVLRARIEEHISYKNTLLSVIELYPTDNDWARGRKQGIQDCINDQDEYIAALTNQLNQMKGEK